MAVNSLDELDLVRQLGRGGYSVVHLVRGCHHAPLCALKAIKQDLVRSPKQAAHIFAERDALKALAGCPFIVRLFDTFKDATHLYFLMECVGGGPLQRHFRGSLAPARGRFGLPRACFYAAEIFLALEACHQQNIVYRDLKASNVLLTREGHVKLTDFGFAKIVKPGELTSTYCGTPHAMAPEVVANKSANHGNSIRGYDHRVDWWSFGILCYEMLVGHPPMGYVASDKLFESILAGLPDTLYPDDVFETDRQHENEIEKKDNVNDPVHRSGDDGPAAKDLIKRCLCLDPNKRLGLSNDNSDSSRSCGGNIDSHPWLHTSVMHARLWASGERRYAGGASTSRDICGSAEDDNLLPSPPLNPRFFCVTEEDDISDSEKLSKKEQDMFAGF